MAVPMVDVNYLAVIIAALIPMILGMIWYSPSVFGKIWMKLSGLDPKRMNSRKKSMGTSYVLAFISALIMSYVLYHILVFAGTASFSEALQGSFWVWLGFVATTMLGSVLWEGRSWKLYWINAGYYLIVLLCMGVLLYSWMS